MRIFQGLGILSEVLSKAKKLLLRERRETFRIRISPSAFREVCRDHGLELDQVDMPHFIERAKNDSRLTPNLEKSDSNLEQKKKES